MRPASTASPYLPIGHYTVAVSASNGFGTQNIPAVHPRSPPDHHLQRKADPRSLHRPRSMSSEAAEILNTNDATLSGTFTANTIQNFPLNGLDFSALTLYLPGAGQHRRHIRNHQASSAAPTSPIPSTSTETAPRPTTTPSTASTTTRPSTTSSPTAPPPSHSRRSRSSPPTPRPTTATSTAEASSASSRAEPMPSTAPPTATSRTTRSTQTPTATSTTCP